MTCNWIGEFLSLALYKMFFPQWMHLIGSLGLSVVKCLHSRQIYSVALASCSIEVKIFKNKNKKIKFNFYIFYQVIYFSFSFSFFDFFSFLDFLFSAPLSVFSSLSSKSATYLFFHPPSFFNASLAVLYVCLLSSPYIPLSRRALSSSPISF